MHLFTIYPLHPFAYIFNRNYPEPLLKLQHFARPSFHRYCSYYYKNVTDSDRQVERVQTHVDISTIITCPSTNWLSNSVGQVDKERLKDFIRDKSKDIVGWFRFRKNESLIPTLQDKILHKELSSSLFSSGTKNHQFFTMCLLNTSVSNRGGTHKFRHVLLRYKNGGFEPIPLRINNLGDDSSRPDGSDYKPTPLHKSLAQPDAFTKIINSLNLDAAKTPGTELVTCIQKAAEYHLDDMIPKLSASDHQVADLERQVRQLQTKILAKKLSNKLVERESSYVVKLNSQREKNDSEREREREKKKEETKISAIRLKNELIDIFNDNSTPVKNPSTIQRQPSHSNKQRNLSIQAQKNVNVNPKNLNQIGAKEKFEFEASKPNTSSVHDPFASVVEVMKTDITQNTSNRERRSQSKESSSSPEVLSVTCPDYNESNSTGNAGRGYGRESANRSDPSDSNFGSKKARRGKARTASEKFSSPSQSSEQEKPKVVAKLEFPVTPLSYSQATRKSNDVNPIRSSDSQEY